MFWSQDFPCISSESPCFGNARLSPPTLKGLHSSLHVCAKQTGQGSCRPVHVGVYCSKELRHIHLFILCPNHFVNCRHTLEHTLANIHEIDSHTSPAICTLLYSPTSPDRWCLIAAARWRRPWDPLGPCTASPELPIPPGQMVVKDQPDAMLLLHCAVFCHQGGTV